MPLIDVWFKTYQSTQYPGPCLMCHETIPIGTKVKLKQGIGIIHLECYPTFKDLETMVDACLFYAANDLPEESSRLAKMILDTISENNFYNFLNPSFYSLDEKNDMEKIIKSLDKNHELHKKSNYLFNTYWKKFLELYFGLTPDWAVEIHELIKNSKDFDELSDDELENVKKGINLMNVLKQRAHELYENHRLRYTKNKEIAFDPLTPLKTHQDLKTIFSSIKKSLIWFDVYFDKESFDLILNKIDFDSPKLKKILIYTGISDWNKLKILKKQYELYKNELKNVFGIDLQIRFLTESKKIHDRYFIIDDVVLTGPSQGYLFNKHCTLNRFNEKSLIDEIHELIDNHHKNNSFDLISDWNKIEKLLPSKSNSFNSSLQHNCSECSRPFNTWKPIPSGRTPRCPNCRKLIQYK